MRIKYKVYSAKWCSVCDKLKALMKQNGEDFEVVDIDEDLEAGEFIIQKGHKTIPQIYKLDVYVGDCKDYIETHKGDKK